MEGMAWAASVVARGPRNAARDAIAFDDLLGRVRCTLAVVGVLGVGGLVLDEVTGSATADRAKPGLAPTEFELLDELASHAGDVITRSGSPWADHISRLRRKLGDDEGWRIVTVRGRGYRFDDRPTRPSQS